MEPELGITLEQFKSLKKNARRSGIEICYDKRTGEWYVNSGALVGAIMYQAGIDMKKGSEIFVKASSHVAALAMLQELSESED
jgi:hypothetical protein